MTCIIASANAASVPGLRTMTSSDWRAASVSRTSIVTTCAPRRRAAVEVAAGVRLAREVRAPEQHQLRVRAHVLLRVDVEHAGDAEAEAAEAPADHRRGSTTASRRGWRTGGPGSCAAACRSCWRRAHGPSTCATPRGRRRASGRDDRVERLVPRRAPPLVRARRAHHRVEQRAAGCRGSRARPGRGCRGTRGCRGCRGRRGRRRPCRPRRRRASRRGSGWQFIGHIVRMVVAIRYAPPGIAISLRAESNCPVWRGQGRTHRIVPDPATASRPPGSAFYRSPPGPSPKSEGTNVWGSAGSVRSACCRGVSWTSGGGSTRARDQAIWETQYL